MKTQPNQPLTIIPSDDKDHGAQIITVCKKGCKDYGMHAYSHGYELSSQDIKDLFQEIQNGKPNKILSFSGVSLSNQIMLDITRRLKKCKNILALRFENIKSKIDIPLLATALEKNPYIKILSFKDTLIDERAAKELAKVMRYRASALIVLIDPSCRVTKPNIRYIINKEHKSNTEYYLLHKIPVSTAIAIKRWCKKRKLSLLVARQKTKPNYFEILSYTLAALPKPILPSPTLPVLATTNPQNVDIQTSCLAPAYKAITYAFNRFKSLGLTSNMAITSVAVTTVALTANSLLFK